MPAQKEEILYLAVLDRITLRSAKKISSARCGNGDPLIARNSYPCRKAGTVVIKIMVFTGLFSLPLLGYGENEK